MSRPVNAIDFWRGFALVEIFINHIPGNLYEHFTHKTLSQSDSAELFVFLAGWSLKHVVGPPHDPRPTLKLIIRLILRAATLYGAHIITVSLAIAMLAAASRLLDNPLLLEWFNAASVFYDPVNTQIGLVLLTHQLGYFDILPLYVVLLLVSPLIALLHRWQPHALLPVSAAIYLSALVTETTIPTWPVEGEWFFNPFCWQFDFVLGFLAARSTGPFHWVATRIRWLRLVAWPLLLIAAILKWYGIEVDPTTAPEPHLLIVEAKSFLSPNRLIQFLILVTAMSGVFPFIDRWAHPLTRVFSLLGRNSLVVFCLGSLMSLAGQIARFAMKGGFTFDTVIVSAGILVMLTFAAGLEWWERSK